MLIWFQLKNFPNFLWIRHQQSLIFFNWTWLLIDNFQCYVRCDWERKKWRKIVDLVTKKDEQKNRITKQKWTKKWCNVYGYRQMIFNPNILICNWIVELIKQFQCVLLVVNHLFTDCHRDEYLLSMHRHFDFRSFYGRSVYGLLNEYRQRPIDRHK